MVVSTGVGGGIVLDGRLLNGRLGNAGHIGHIVVVPDGRRLRLRQPGLSGGGGVGHGAGRPDRAAGAAGLAGVGGAHRACSSAAPSPSVADLLDLSLAVVSGSVALGFGEPFFRAAQAEMDELCRIAYAHGARVVPGGLDDRGPLVGAARVGLIGAGLVA